MSNDILLGYLDQLSNAKHGEKGAIQKEACELLDISKDKFFRIMKSLGWDSGRAKRKDAGTTGQDVEALEKVKGVLATSVRKNGKQVMYSPTAIAMLSQNGCDFKSASTVNRLLREQHASIKQLNAPNATITMRSLYPNHVHQVDPSLCLIYYPPGGKKGKVQRFMSDDEFYQNKPANLEKIKNLRVWRYVLTDHYSGAIRVYYFESAGETTANLYKFLLWCWGLNDDKNCPMRGMPDILYMDKGSANTSKSMVRALENGLNIEVQTHEVGRSNAKGQVEKANDLVETLFESRLAYEPVDSVAQLNERATAWQNAYNSDTIPNYNAKHGRHKKARYEMWMRVLATGKVRDLPDEKICKWLLLNKEQTRLVKQNLSIPFVHPAVGKTQDYDLSGLAGIYAGLKVLVMPMALSNKGEIVVFCKFQGQEQLHQVTPIITNEAGFDVNAPIFGQEINSHKDTVVDEQRKAADRIAYPGLTDDEITKAKRNHKITPFAATLDAHSHLNHVDTPDYMTVRGEQHVTGLETPAEKRLSGLALKQAILVKRSGVHITAEENQFLSNLGEVAESELDSVVQQLEQLNTSTDDNVNVVNFKR